LDNIIARNRRCLAEDYGESIVPLSSKDEAKSRQTQSRFEKQSAKSEKHGRIDMASPSPNGRCPMRYAVYANNGGDRLCGWRNSPQCWQREKFLPNILLSKSRVEALTLAITGVLVKRLQSVSFLILLRLPSRP